MTQPQGIPGSSRIRPTRWAMPGSVVPFLLAAWVAPTMTACVDDSSGRPRVRGLTTREVVNEVRSGWTTEMAWRFEEDLRLGSTREGAGDGSSGNPHLFADVISIAANSRGSIHVLDWASQDIRTFDSTGHFRHRIGGRGSGPGEFMGARTVSVDPGDTLWVLDDAAGRVSLFAPDGSFLRQYRRSPAGFVPSASGTILHDGSLLDWHILTPEGRMGARVLYEPRRVSVSTGQTDSFPPIEHHLTMLPSGRMPETLFGDRLVVGPEPDGHIWFAHSREYRVFRRSLEGDTTVSFSLDARAAPLGDRERQVVNREFGHLPRVLSEYLDALPATRPVIHRLLAAGTGHLLVFADVAGEVKGSIVDIFREDGTFLGRSRLPRPLPLGRPGLHPVVHLRGDYLYAAIFDDEDVPQVSRFRLIREKPTH